MANREVLHTISSSSESAIAVEVFETRLMRKHKHTLVFESFSGQLHFTPDHPERSRLSLDVDAKSVVCRDRFLKENKQRRVADYVRDLVLEANSYPSIHFCSDRMSAKALRGFVMEGELKLRGTVRALKMNVVLNARKDARLQIDADGKFQLSDFGIKPPSSLFGLIGTKDEVLIQMLLWTAPTMNATA
jgi:polyisoprenoid-binding protein YceI